MAGNTPRLRAALCTSAMSTPYYGPNEDENTINIEKFFLAGDFVSGVGYGACRPMQAPRLRLMVRTTQAFSSSSGRNAHNTSGSNGRGASRPAFFCAISACCSPSRRSPALSRHVLSRICISRTAITPEALGSKYFLETQSHPVDVLFDSTVFILTFLCDLLVVSGLDTHPQSSTNGRP